MRKTFITAAAALALTFAAGQAYASTFVAIGDTAIIDYNGIVEGNIDPDLDADLVLTLTGISGNDFTFSYSLTNTSGGDDLTARVVAFGFNVDPNFSTASVTGTFTDWDSGNVPGGLPDVEFCAISGSGNNCSGGAGGGVGVGETGSGSIILTFANAPSLIDITNFYARYQSLANGGSGVGTGTPCVDGPDCDGGGGGNEIPEPSTWALMILGFGSAGAMLRRSRRSLTKVAA
jgi:hypothetical protein